MAVHSGHVLVVVEKVPLPDMLSIKPHLFKRVLRYAIVDTGLPPCYISSATY